MKRFVAHYPSSLPSAWGWLVVALLALLGCVRMVPPLEPPYLYSDSTVQAERRVTRYWSLRVQDAFYVYRAPNGDWVKHGPEVHFYTNGQKAYTMQWLHGKKEGLAEFWYQNGQKQGESHYHENVLDGEALSWYASGKLESVKHWKKGKLDGPQVLRNPDGSLKDSTYWEDNKLKVSSPE